MPRIAPTARLAALVADRRSAGEAPAPGPTIRRAGGLETPLTIELPGGPLEIVLRRSPRARRIRILVDHGRGVVVTVPVRRGDRSDPRVPDREVERFLREREGWLRRHAARRLASAERAVRGAELGDGATLRFRGDPHLVRIAAAPPGARRSSVSRDGADEGDLIVVALAGRDRRRPDGVLRDWLVERARIAIEVAVADHASALGVAPRSVTVRDPRTRWGSASRTGGLSFSWRLVLAPPPALETVVVHELAHLRVFGHGPAFWALVAGRRPDHAEWRRWLRRHAAELHSTLE